MTRVAFPPSEPVRLPPARALAEGVALSKMYGMTLSPADVARVLERAKVRYVLVGAHAANLYTGKPRATQDVDVVTGAHTKARQAILAEYPQLTVEDHPVVVRFKEGGREVLDLIKARSGKLFAEVLRHVTTVTMDGASVEVATLEAVLAMKFASMTNPARRMADRHLDAADFSHAATFSGETNLPLLRRLGELAYAGGGESIVKLFDDARAGRRLDI